MNKSIRIAMGVASVVSAFAVTSVIGIPSASAQQNTSAAQKQIVGVWRLVSADTIEKDGRLTTGTFGPTPKGVFILTSSGHYASVSTHSDLPKFASGNRLQGTAEENKAIVQGSNSHFGTYSVSADGKVLTLKVEGGTWPGWIGNEQKRDLVLAGDDMKYSLAASVGGRATLAFKRVK